MLAPLFKSLGAIVLATSASAAHASCNSLASVKEIGLLDHKEVPEASGLALSRTVPGRLYHVNDAGSTGHFYMTDIGGRHGQRVELSYKPRDTEDLAVASCGQGGGSCLFIADIGDNDEVRPDISIVLVREKASYGRSETPTRILRLRYPDGAHNAEGFSVHPNGDMFIVTKGKDTAIYKLAANRWQDEGRSSFDLQKVATIDITSLSAGEGKKAFITSFDISNDGSSFLLLTNSDVFEVDMDLSTISSNIDTRQLHRSGLLRRLDVKNLKQQEAVAYTPGSQSFFYSSESKKKDAPLMLATCRN